MASQTPETQDDLSSPKTKILVVDDEPSLLTLLRNYLEPMYDVLTADRADEALRQVADAPPGLALVDLYMPEMDGFEFIMALRGKHPGVPVIVMSGGSAYGDMSSLRVAKHLVNSILTKPFTRAVLLDAVAEALNES